MAYSDIMNVCETLHVFADFQLSLAPQEVHQLVLVEFSDVGEHLAICAIGVL
jgi:hypothetical protein